MESKTPAVTADEIVNKSKQWSLEGDCTLLRWMEQISKNLEKRATKTTSDLNELSTRLERTSIALSNATNCLAALQYTQFVENRVHDDDETLANVNEVPNPSSDVVDRSSNGTSMYSFLKKNLEMMNSCHEAYAFSYDDSDEDEPATNVVYRSKNPYEARPLPHIYGTNLWKEKWHIGLCDSDTDFSGDENSEQFSESSSETDNSYESTAQTMSEWDSTAWGLNANSSMEQKQFRLPSNDGESYTHSEVSTPTEQRKDRLPIVQPVQDQRYYQHIPRKQEKQFDDIFDDSAVQSTPTQSVAPQAAASPVAPARQEKIYHESLIPDEPPPDEPEIENEPNKRLGAKKTLNLFDDDEFSSFMNQIVETAKNVNSVPQPRQEDVQEPPKKIVPNLFEDHDDLFGASDSGSKAFNEPKKVPPQKVEEETFVPRSPPKAVQKTKIRNLFEDDEEEEDDFEKMFAVKQSGADSFLKKATNLFENDSDIEHEVAQIGGAAPAVATVSSEAKVREVPLMKKGLFDDEEDDDMFAIPTKKLNEGTNSLKSENKVEGIDVTLKEKTRELGDQRAEKPPVLGKTGFEDLFHDKPPADVFTPTASARQTKVADIFADDFADDFEEFLPKATKKLVAKEPAAVEPSPKEPSAMEPVAKQPAAMGRAKKELIDQARAPFEQPLITSKVNFGDLFEAEPPEDIFPSSLVSKGPKMAEVLADDFHEDLRTASNPEVVPPEPAPRDKDNPVVIPQTREESLEADIFESKAENIDDAATTELPKCSQDDPILPPKTSTTLPVPPKMSDEQHSTSEHLTDQKPRPSPPVPSFSNLFPDEPPSDDEVPIGSTSTEKDAPTFSSINLFADVPPDDDFQVSLPTETKRIHSIFYDDFNETIEATREMRAPSNYIFNDEPPPDDDAQPIEDKSLPVADETKEKERPKVSKLKKFDLQINVGALLPTAKLPSFKKPDTVPQRVTSTPSPAATPIEASSKEVRENRDLPENILPNLNKDRVKLGVKRRPSTRKGRQESYRKSMIEEEAAATLSDQESDAQAEESDRKKPSVKATGRDSNEEIFDSRTFLSKSVSNAQEEQKQHKSEPPSLSTNRAGSLFEDFGDFDGGKLFGNSKAQQEISADSPFHDNEAVINPFGTPKTTPVRPPADVTTNHGFDPKQNLLEKEQSKPVVQSNNVTSLFDDSDDGSDDLFKDSKSMKKPTLQRIPESKGKGEPAAKPVAKPSKAPSSLFSSDEESESDDIFGKSKLKVPPKKIETTKAKQSSSLFADLSDDDEDDLFGTAKKKPSAVDKSKVKPSKTPQPSKATAPPPQQHQPTTASYNPLSDLLDD